VGFGSREQLGREVSAWAHAQDVVIGGDGLSFVSQSGSRPVQLRLQVSELVRRESNNAHPARASTSTDKKGLARRPGVQCGHRAGACVAFIDLGRLCEAVVEEGQ
jgi:hypothetical protein